MAATLVETPLDQLRRTVFFEFLYGSGTVPGIDLGRTVSYTRDDGVYRHEFQRGVTLANVGSGARRVEVGEGYEDLGGTPRTYVELGPHTAEVLLRPPPA